MARELRILGPLEVVDDGRAVDLGGPRQRAVLALLLLHAGDAVPADRLIEELWSGSPPEGAAGTLQSYVSKLRRELGRQTIVTRGGGYALEPGVADLDLRRFERLAAEASGLPAAQAAEKLREALSLWRGPALSEFAYESWAQAPIARLEELRLAALESRIEADLELGRHTELTAELSTLVHEHPLRERLHALRMLALYRSGRQVEALEAYRLARATLIEEVGIEPGPALRELEKAILRQDDELDGPTPPRSVATRSILVVASNDAAILPLVAVAEPLARHSQRELIAVRLVRDGEDPGRATAHLAALRDELVARGMLMRVVSYTSDAPGEDVTRLAAEQDVDLVLLDASPTLLEDGAPDRDLAAVLADGIPDVAVLFGTSSLHRETKRPVVVPFGGVEHDWSAVELAAWIAQALGTKLLLVGTAGDGDRRDASRLLGRASLVVQAVVGVVAEPMLVVAGVEGMLKAAADASLLVLGLSTRWKAEGLGSARLGVLRASAVPTLLVRSGLRPGGLAPAETMTRFTWTLSA